MSAIEMTVLAVVCLALISAFLVGIIIAIENKHNSEPLLKYDPEQRFIHRHIDRVQSDL